MESSRRNRNKSLTKVKKYVKKKTKVKTGSVTLTKKQLKKLPKFEIIKKTEPSWFDKALANIEAGKEPFED